MQTYTAMVFIINSYLRFWQRYSASLISYKKCFATLVKLYWSFNNSKDNIFLYNVSWSYLLCWKRVCLWYCLWQTQQSWWALLYDYQTTSNYTASVAPDGLTSLHTDLHAVKATSVSLLGLQAQFILQWKYRIEDDSEIWNYKQI